MIVRKKETERSVKKMCVEKERQVKNGKKGKKQRVSDSEKDVKEERMKKAIEDTGKWKAK